MNDPVRYATDPWSRFMSLGSLILAAAVMAWAFFCLPDAPTREEIMSRYKQNMALVNDENADFREDLGKRHTEIIEEFQQRAEKTLADQQRQWVATLRDRGNLSPTAYAQSSPGDGTTDSDNAAENDQASADADALALSNPDGAEAKEKSSEPLNDERAANDVAEPTEAVAQLVRRVILQKPSDPAANNTIVLRNIGVGEARIQGVAFVPSTGEGDIFEIEQPPKMSASDTEPAESLLNVVFGPADNQAIEDGKHGVYWQLLDEIPTVPVDGEIKIRLAIADSKHFGWGFRGKLELQYNGAEPLEIDNVELAFVAADDS